MEDHVERPCVQSHNQCIDRTGQAGASLVGADGVESGHVGMGASSIPMDTRDATLDQALVRGQLDRTAIMRPDKQTGLKGPADLDAAQSDDAVRP